MTADVSYLKAVMEVRGEIVAAGYTPSAEVPTAEDLDIAIERLVAHELPGRRDRRGRRRLADPGLHGVSIRGDIGGRLDRVGAEQLSRPAEQRTHFIQLLLQP